VSLHIETRHHERTVVLRCEDCAVVVPVATVGEGFAVEVQTFFEGHSGCSPSVQLDG
jgi:hypothetical protein